LISSLIRIWFAAVTPFKLGEDRPYLGVVCRAKEDAVRRYRRCSPLRDGEGLGERRHCLTIPRPSAERINPFPSRGGVVHLVEFVPEVNRGALEVLHLS